MAVFDNLEELIDLLGDAPGVAELTIQRPGGVQVTIKRSAPRAQSQSPEEQPVPEAGSAPASASLPSALPRSDSTMAAAAPQTPSQSSLALAGAALAVSADARSASAPLAEAASTPDAEVPANRVGIYHQAKPPLEIGDQVSSGQIVGYIEAIKLMNEVRAPSAGTIADQFVEDGMPVEYGQALFRIRAE